MRHLTKSRFSLALECPTKLEYCDDPSFANANLDNEFLAALADGGHQVGALAKCLFPDGIEVDAIGRDAQVAQTERLLQQNTAAVFEAAIRFGRLFIRADLLNKHGNAIDLYEVKAKGFDSTDPDSQVLGKKGGFLSGMKPYLYDVAFQRYVLRKAFPGATIRAHLVMPDKSALCRVPQLAQRLRIRKDGRCVRIDVDPSLQDGVLARQVLCVVPVDNYLDQLEQEPLQMGAWVASFGEGIEDLARRLDDEPYSPRPGSHCKSCQFRATVNDLAVGKQDGRLRCWTEALPVTLAELTRGSVFDLYSSKATEALLTEGKALLVDLEPEDLKLAEKPDEISTSHRQWLQSEEARGAITHPFIRASRLQNSIAELAYPLHFIDFETSRPALPFHADRRPYEQLLFQFSHHQLEGNGTLCHATQHLAASGDALPSFGTVRALKLALGNDHGSVLHWWDHERTVLGEVRNQLALANAADVPDRGALLDFIDQLVGTKEIRGRLVDLGRLIHSHRFLPWYSRQQLTQESVAGPVEFIQVPTGTLRTSHLWPRRWNTKSQLHRSGLGTTGRRWTDRGPLLPVGRTGRRSRSCRTGAAGGGGCHRRRWRCRDGGLRTATERAAGRGRNPAPSVPAAALLRTGYPGHGDGLARSQ